MIIELGPGRQQPAAVAHSSHADGIGATVRCRHFAGIRPPMTTGTSGYLAANLYAKSVFGEDALVNLSVEKQADGKLAGYIRIRSKTQGIALSLGDKITLKVGAAVGGQGLGRAGIVGDEVTGSSQAAKYFGPLDQGWTRATVKEMSNADGGQAWSKDQFWERCMKAQQR